MRRLRNDWVLFALFVLCLAVDAWVYGSLALDPTLGPVLVPAARDSAPLLHTYIDLGRPFAAHLDAAAGAHFARMAFGGAYASMAARPAEAPGLLFSGSRGPIHDLLVALYWGAPVLLVLALGAWVLRSRETHLMGRVRQ
ncbi:MAG TPA: hypothetical protein VJ862_10635 [Rhodanobacteraceae bacterium]|nr:hypothetical protein [Rhodanobacteraceae bacterium]